MIKAKMYCYLIQVMLEIEFEMVQRDYVDLKFWLIMNDRESAKLVKEFSQYYKKLTNLKIKPVYQIFNGQGYQLSDSLCLGNN